MTKPKRSSRRRGGGTRKLRAPAGYRLRAGRSRRKDGRSKNIDIWFERIGEYYDDVLISFEDDGPAVAAIRALPLWAGWWDADFQVWRIHPGYADRLAAALQDLGYTVRCPRKAAKGDEALVMAG